MSLPVYTVRKGDKGQVVRWIQERLGVTPDAAFGPQTEHEVVQWQLLHGLDADGICGPATLASMGIRVTFGIDVSHYQGAVDWAAVRAAGVKWVCVKVSQGNGGDDPQGAHNLACATAAGFSPLAYHFAVPDARAGDATLEAHCAIDRANGAPLVLDLEQTGGLDRVALGKWSLAFLAEVERLTGRTPWLYTTGDYLRNRIAGVDLSRFPKWIARYWDRHDDPDAPVEWAAWQFTSAGQVPGIKGHVDCNWVVSRD